MSAQKSPVPQPKAFYVSRETVRKLFHELDQFELENRRWGRRVANRRREPRGAGVLVHRPLERTEIDHFKLDIHLVDEQGLAAGRPFLTMIVDCHSRMVLGYTLSLATPNATTILTTIRHAISLKPPLRIDRQALGHSLDSLPLNQELNWEVAGIMSTVVMDNGADFKGLSVRSGLDEIGVEVQFCPPKEPWFKGIIERIGRTINLRLIHWLPGTTYGKVTRDDDYQAKAHASLTLDDLRQRLEIMIWVYNRTAHRGIGKRTPLEAWREGVAQWPIQLPPENNPRFEAAMCLTDERALQKYGIEYNGEKFQSDELGALWNRMPAGSKVMIKIDPTDVNFIYVIDPRSDEAFKVPNTRPRNRKVSWDMYEAAKARGKELGLDHAEHEPAILQAMTEASRTPPPRKRRKAKKTPAPQQAKTPGPAPDTDFRQRTKAPEPPGKFDPATLFKTNSKE
jgi:putative transposase